MKEITKECFFRPRIYKDSLSVNVFYRDVYLGSIREGGRIDFTNGAKGFSILEQHDVFEVFEHEKEKPISKFTNLTIESDGTSRNTKVVTDKGKVIMGITNIDICIGLDDEVTAVIKVIQPKIKLSNVKAVIIKDKQ